MRQIQDYKGHRIDVEMKDGRHISGILAYYNYDAQVIHLTDVETVYMEDLTHPFQAEFMIINKDVWHNISISDISHNGSDMERTK